MKHLRLCSLPRYGAVSDNGKDMALSLFMAKTWCFCSRPKHGVVSVHGEDMSLFTVTT